MTEDEKAAALLEQAIDWLLRLKEAPAGGKATQQFEAWLGQSAAHSRAWDKACRTWQVMGEAAPAHEHLWKPRAGPNPAARRSSTSPRAASRATRRRSWKPRVPAAIAVAAIGLFCFIAAPSLLLRIQADHMTGTGESRAITLADGSIVTLGAHSAIATDISGSQRHVTLLAGEAFFDVVHDPAHPFVVDAGGVDVRVLGTAFNVSLASDTASVELARGSVRVATARTDGDKTTTLVPGEKVVVDRTTGAMDTGSIALDDIAAWRNGQLFVNDATIGAVVERLRRYHPAWISLPDATLARQRVTGLYDLRDPDRALRAIVQPYGGQVHAISPYLRVLSRF